MRPWKLVNKFLEDQRSCYRAAMGSPDIFHVSDTAFDQFTIVLNQGELPKFFSALARATKQLIGERLMVAENTGDFRSQRYHASSGQCRQVDHVVGFLLC